MAKDGQKGGGYKPPPKPFSLDAPEINPDDFELPKRSRSLPEIDTDSFELPPRENERAEPARQEKDYNVYRAAQRSYGQRRPGPGNGPPPPGYRPPPRPPRYQGQSRGGPPRRQRPGPKRPKPPRRQINPAFKKYVSLGIAGITLVILAVIFITRIFSYNAFAVYVDDVHVGYIPMGNRVLTSDEFHDEVVNNIYASRRARVVVDQRVTITEARAANSDISTRQAMVGILARDYFTYQLEATEIWVNGIPRALMRNRAEALYVAERLFDAFRTENTVHAEFTEGHGHTEPWQLRYVLVDPNETEFDTPSQAVARLDEHVHGFEAHIVQSGEFLMALSMRFDVLVDRIMRDNGLTSDIIHPGQVLQIYTRVPLLNVLTIDEYEGNAPIPMEVERSYNPGLSQGLTNVLTEGRDGLQEGFVRVTKINGREIDREMIEGETIIEPITRVMEVGTGPAR